MELARMTCNFSVPHDEYWHSKTKQLMLCGAGVREWFPSDPLGCSIDIVLHDRPGANRIKFAGRGLCRRADGVVQWLLGGLSNWMEPYESPGGIVYLEIQYEP